MQSVANQDVRARANIVQESQFFFNLVQDISIKT